MVISKVLSIEDFKTLILEDKPIFDKYYKKYPPIHSDYVFTSLISWMQYSKYRYVEYKNNLIIMSQIKDDIRFRPPIGERNKEVFNQVLRLSRQQKNIYPFGMIDSETKKWMEKNYPKIVFKPHREFFDYVYLASDLAQLNGSVYSKIRNRLNKFKKNYLYTVEHITKENMDEAQEFLHRWCLWKDCESDPILENEKKAILYSIDHFSDLGLSGITIRINDKIEALSVFEKMNPDTAVVHYEKGSPDYDGIYKAINQETAKMLQKHVKYINRESDMNIPGLRKAKMSYHPDHMIEVSHIEKQNLVL
jgi:hypothetical protein